MSSNAVSINLPNADGIGNILERLIGLHVRLQVVQPVAVVAEKADWYATTMIDDDEQIVGAMMADFVASLFLGSSLMMLPRVAVDEQLKEKKLTDLVVESLSEVFNNLTVAVNSVAGNQHIRSASVTSLDPQCEDYAWILEANETRVFCGEFPNLGEGRLVFMSR